jgi:hypothetical protein
MKLFLLSLAYSNPDSTVVVFVDKDIQTMIQGLGKLRLKLTMVENLNEYSGKHRKQMESEGIWSTFQMTKSKILEYCLALYPDVLFLDSDILVINEITVPDSCELALSPHYIRKMDTDRFGYYNGGCVWTNNKDMPSKWRLYTETSRFFDQASLEDCAKIFTTKVFGENYNISWWRVLQSDEPPAKMSSYFSYKRDNIYFKGKPIVFVHTHFTDETYAGFNNMIRNLLMLCKAKQKINQFF